MTRITRLFSLLLVAFGLLGVSCSSTQGTAKGSLNSKSLARLASTSPKPALYKKGSLLCTQVKTTAYCHKESDHIAYKSACAVGCGLRYDKSVRSAAADWSVFPVGTVFRLAGNPQLYRIDDYGSALVGTRTIDLYQPTMSMVKGWGARNVEIEIVKWGSYTKSFQILSARTGHNHCRAMVASLQKKGLVRRTS